MSRTSELMIESGIIPKNTLQQLVNWRLIPEGSEVSHGKHPVSLDSSNKLEVKRFIKELSEALRQDMTEIRETELDSAGGYERADLGYESKEHVFADVFVDRLERVVIPPTLSTPSDPVSVEIPARGKGARKVVRVEVRYLGDRPVAKVLYLESEETNV